MARETTTNGASLDNGTIGIVDASNGRENVADLIAQYKAIATATRERPSVERTRQRRADGKLGPVAAPKPAAAPVALDADTGLPLGLLAALEVADQEAAVKPPRAVDQEAQRARTLATRGIMLKIAYSDDGSTDRPRFLNAREVAEYLKGTVIPAGRPGTITAYRYEVIPNAAVAGAMKAEQLWTAPTRTALKVSRGDALLARLAQKAADAVK